MPITPGQAANSETGILKESGLTSNQATFVEDLSGETGLNADVVAAWVLAEENGSAASARQAQGDNDWLNIRTGSGFGSSSGVWATPASAAKATADFMKGASVPGVGTASSGIQGILKSVNGSPSAQIAAIGGSGWGTVQSVIESTYSHLTNQKGLLAKLTKAATSPLVTAGSAASDAAGDVASSAGAISSIATELGDVWSAITNPSNWLRALEILGAIVLIYFALTALTGRDPTAIVEKGAAVAALA